MGEWKLEERADWCGARASNKKERRWHLTRHANAFYIRMQGRTDLRRNVKAHAWLYCAASSYQEREKQLGTLFFKATILRGVTQLSHDATAQNGSARRPPWHPNFKRTKNRRRTWGRYMQPRGIFYGERLLSRKKLTALWFSPASKGRKLHGNSGWEFSCCAFSHKGDEPILQKQVECFDMNRVNQWVQASQSLTGSQRGRSSARCNIYGNIAHNEALPDERPISPRFCPTAKRCLCHARLWILLLRSHRFCATE